MHYVSKLNIKTEIIKKISFLKESNSKLINRIKARKNHRRYMTIILTKVDKSTIQNF